jgi:Fic family protein
MAYMPKFTISAYLLGLIEEISALREKIAAATVQVSWIPALQKDSRARNTHSSTAIEGNPLTLEQVRILADGQALSGVQERAQREVLNYFAGLRFIESHIRRTPITHAAILALHGVIATGAMDQGEAGKYRTTDVRVGGYHPPRHAEVPGLLAELLLWWNKEAHGWSPVLTSAIIHYRFEAIHPFADGNGRTGRALALWELYRRGFDSQHIFSVDEGYWEERPRYYHELDAVRSHGDDLTRWLEYTADVLHETLQRVWRRSQRLAVTAKAPRIVLRPRQEQLLQLLQHYQSMAPAEIWKALGVSRQGALDLLNPLLKAGLVMRTGNRKSGRYLLKR